MNRISTTPKQDNPSTMTTLNLILNLRLKLIRLHLVLIFALSCCVNYGHAQEVSPPETLEELLDQNSQLHTVILLDSVLCLNESQWKKANRLVSEQWDSKWNSDMQAMTLSVFGGTRRDIIESLDLTELRSDLSAGQLNALEDFSKFSSFDFSDVLGESQPPELEAKLADHKNTLGKLIDVKIEELLKLTSANKKQTKMLEVARNGVLSRAETQWRDVIKIYAEDPTDAETEQKAMSLIRRHLLQQCTTDAVWQQGLSKVF